MLPVQRVECRDCGIVRQVKVDFAKRRRSYTKPFERYVLELSKHMTIDDVARHLGVSWGTVRDIQPKSGSCTPHPRATAGFRLKGTRWLLLKNPGNLDDKCNEAQRLQEALRLNQPLATAYYMKEDLRLLWEQPNKHTAQEFLSDWIARANSSGIRMLKEFAKTLAAHRSGILAYYDYPISTGPLEGTNTKIRVLQRQAYGFRNTEFFKLKIMALHETKCALVG